MSLFSNPEEHAANPPSTWLVVKTGGCWSICAADGYELEGNFDRKRDAEAARTSGFAAQLYAKETRWYAGESVRGWKPYSEVAHT
jgi:hypothetical protein